MQAELGGRGGCSVLPLTQLSVYCRLLLDYDKLLTVVVLNQPFTKQGRNSYKNYHEQKNKVLIKLT